MYAKLPSMQRVHFLNFDSLQVHGIIRRSSSFNTGRIEHLYADPKSHSGGCKLYDPGFAQA